MQHFPCHRLPMRLSLLTLCLGLAAPGWTQSVVAQPTTQVTLSLPAQPLDKALTELAARTGLMVGADSRLLAGKQAPALSGTYTPLGALQQLLAGSGLEAVPGSDGSLQLRRISAAGDEVLPTVSVKGMQETASGPVRGYVARRSATATKTDTALIENPQSVSVITAEEILDRKAESLDEALRYTAGVTPNLKPWAVDEFSLLRGFELGTAGVFMDGLLTSGRAYASPIEPYGLERLEVLRGPASVMYGKMPPGGMINAVSKRPTAEVLRDIGVEYGTYGRKQVKADFAGALDADKRWTYRLTLLNRESGTRIDHDRDDRLYIAPALTWQPTADTKLTLLSRYQKETQSYAWPNQLQYPGPLGQPDPSVNIGGYDNRWRRENSMFGYEFEHRFDQTWTLRQNARYTKLDRSERNVFPRGLQADGQTVNRSFSPRETHWRGLLIDTNVQAQFASGGIEHTLLAGFDYAKGRTKDEFPYATPMVNPLNLFAPTYTPIPLTASADPYVNNIPTTQRGLYVQDQLKWDKWVVTAGMRHDSANTSGTRSFTRSNTSSLIYDNSASATSGRVGAVYLFESGWAPYMNYSTSFSPETGNDVTGKALMPSKGRQVEAGIRYQPVNRNVSYTASVFDIVRTNVTTAAPNAPGEYIQSGEVRSRGLELEARAELVKNVSLVAQYTWLDTKITRSNNGDQGLTQMSVPRHNASLWAKRSFVVSDETLAFAALGVRHLGKSRSAWDTDNLNIQNPRMTMIDMALGVENGPWRFTLNINNLFDKQWLMDCNGSICYRSGERTANLSAQYRF